jgi:Family of unknown function (DUF5321)
MATYAPVSARLLGYTIKRSLKSIKSNTHLTQSHKASTDRRSVPKIAQPSIWQSIVPRALRNRSEKTPDSDQKKSLNPASYFIWIYLLIGSQAIRIIGVQNEFKTFMRRAELKIEKLRQVVEALQRGEEVDVEKALGTGDEVQEREWEDALREIETEDRVWQTNQQKRREAKQKAKEEAEQAANEDTASPVNESVNKSAALEDKWTTGQIGRPSAPGFY